MHFSDRECKPSAAEHHSPLIGCTPFAGIAEHIVKAPGVGFFLADLMGLFIGGLFCPSVVVIRFDLDRAGATGVFPFGFAWQAVLAPSLLGKPSTKHLSRVRRG